MKRTVNIPNEEINEKKFEMPSEKEHLFQVVDVYEKGNVDWINDDDVIAVKLEVAIGDELGRTCMKRLNINPDSKAFFMTRMMLKALGEGYKGQVEIDTDRWIGRQFYATVKHSEYKGKTYANIDEFNFEKSVSGNPGGAISPSEIAWDE